MGMNKSQLLSSKTKGQREQREILIKYTSEKLYSVNATMKSDVKSHLNSYLAKHIV